MFTSNFFPQTSSASEQFSDFIPMDDMPPPCRKADCRKQDGRALLQQIKHDMELTRSHAPRLPSAQESREGQKKCLNCRRFYTEALEERTFFASPSPSDPCPPPAGCWYHPGRWKDVTIREGTKAGWSCCRDGLVGANADAFDYHSKGCKYAPFHAEDELYTNTIMRFAFQPNAAQEHQRQQQQQQQKIDSPKQQQPAIAKRYDAEVLQQIPLCGTETMEGLALRYNITVAELKRINRFHTREEMLLMGAVYVPKLKGGAAPVVTVLPLPMQFMSATKCTAAEASYYLSLADKDLERAMLLYREDMKWEASQSQPIL